MAKKVTGLESLRLNSRITPFAVLLSEFLNQYMSADLKAEDRVEFVRRRVGPKTGENSAWLSEHIPAH